MALPVEDVNEISELLLALGNEIARRCSIAPSLMRYFADVHRDPAPNDVGYTINGATSVLGSSDLYVSPADALHLCEDGTFCLGLGVVPAHSQRGQSQALLGFKFRVYRGADGRFGIEKVVATFAQSHDNYRFPPGLQSRLFALKDFVSYFRPIRQAA